MVFNLFFGSTYDFLIENIGRFFLLKYSILLPLIFLSLIGVAIFFKKTNRKLTRVTFYLNTLFCILISWEVLIAITQVAETKPLSIQKTDDKLIKCDTCSKPDIYLIIADEYAGHEELKDIFHYDNSPFEQELANRGFHLTKNSKSNYSATVYSMASMLNMSYLSKIKNNIQSHVTILEAQMLLQKNTIAPFFQKMGYDIYNYSIFEINEKTNLVSDPFYASPYEIFVAQTLIFKLYHDIGFNFASQKSKERITRHNYYNNSMVESSTLAAATLKSPKLVYSHFSIPHPPYIQDSTGRQLTGDSLNWDSRFNKELYLSYLKFSNKYFLNIVDTILKKSTQPPVILLISDHGFRQFKDPVDKKYHFMNLNAVYLPGGNYSGFYNGMSNVNLFRTVLNSQFGQHLPMLKDSTVFLIEPELNL